MRMQEIERLLMPFVQDGAMFSHNQRTFADNLYDGKPSTAYMLVIQKQLAIR